MIPDLVLTAVIEICKTFRVISEGQPPEVKKQMWEWFIEDQKKWREFWSMGGNK